MLSLLHCSAGFVLVCLLSLQVFASPPRSLNTSVVRQISPGLFTCKNSNQIVQAVCSIVLKTVNEELQSRQISISNNGVLFKYTDPTDRWLDTGHSCSVRVLLLNVYYQGLLTSAASIQLKGNMLYEPVVVALKLPVNSNARVDMRKEFGIRFFGKCRRYARDTFYATGALSTLADITVGLSLKPSFRARSDGDYELCIQPEVALLFDLENHNLSFRIHGMSWLTRIYSFVKSKLSGILTVVSQIFKGDSIKSIFNGILRRVVFRIGSIVAVNYHLLPGAVRDVINKQLLKGVNRIAEKKAKGFGDDQEDKLNTELRSILKTDSNGKRTIVVRKEIVDFVRSQQARFSFSTTRTSLSGTELLVEYQWPQREKDLDTNTQFLGEQAGYSCRPSGTYVSFNGDRTGFGDTESSVVKLGAAQDAGKWSTATTVYMNAHWHNRISGPVILRVTLRDAASKQAIPGATVTNFVLPGTLRGCSVKRVASLVVRKSSSTAYSFSLTTY